MAFDVLVEAAFDLHCPVEVLDDDVLSPAKESRAQGPAQPSDKGNL
jgi:hypothetical protein